MNNLTRRTFMTRGSVGVAFAAAIAAAPGAATVLRQSTPSATWTLPAAFDEPLIAHIRDLNTGEIVLLVGTREVVHKDVELAGRLYAAAQRAR
jgi:TRAP-type mannitol/chloroaromatic compound transport system substrate-binding protein